MTILNIFCTVLVNGLNQYMYQRLGTQNFRRTSAFLLKRNPGISRNLKTLKRHPNPEKSFAKLWDRDIISTIWYHNVARNMYNIFEVMQVRRRLCGADTEYKLLHYLCEVVCAHAHTHAHVAQIHAHAAVWLRPLDPRPAGGRFRGRPRVHESVSLVNPSAHSAVGRLRGGGIVYTVP